MRQRDLVRNMGMRELLEQMAYDLSQDEKFRKSYELDKSIRDEKGNYSPEKEAMAIAAAFGMKIKC